MRRFLEQVFRGYILCRMDYNFWRISRSNKKILKIQKELYRLETQGQNWKDYLKVILFHPLFVIKSLARRYE